MLDWGTVAKGRCKREPGRTWNVSLEPTPMAVAAIRNDEMFSICMKGLQIQGHVGVSLLQTLCRQADEMRPVHVHLVDFSNASRPDLVDELAQ